MARIVGGVTTSHIPAIGNAMAEKKENDPYWRRFFAGYEPVKEWLDRVRPDVAVVIYNDHGLNFFLDNIPTFAIGCADRYENADEGWGLNTLAAFEGDAQLSWHIAESLIDQGFDLATCQRMLVDHGFCVPMALMWRHLPAWPVKVVPLAINTVQHPIPSARRLLNLGKALGEAIRSYPEDQKVVIFGTGGLSHQLQGERAGLVNVEFDLACMESVIQRPEWLADLSTTEIIEKAGTEGVEVIMWLAMRGALKDQVRCLHKHYHTPISNTGAGVLLLESD
jgi:protocatechuate 4,5-dioxygenase beta chain